MTAILEATNPQAYDLRNFNFTHTWNSLPKSDVVAPSVNSFKNRIDKFWKRKAA